MRYAAWIVILIGLVIPLRPMFGPGLVTIGIPQTVTIQDYMPFAESTPTLPLAENVGQGQDTDTAVQNLTRLEYFAQTNAFSFMQIAAIIWLAVAAVTFVWHMWKYFRFLRAAKRWSAAVEDESVLSVFRSVQEEKGLIGKRIGLRRCNFVATSMLAGFFRPVVFLPDNDFDDEELALIFRHEFIHYKRRDLYVKFLSMVVVSLHWFNPLVYLMSNAMQTDCEASCDEAVLTDSDIDGRQFYAELIMEMVSAAGKRGTVLSTCFYGTKRGIKIRMETIIGEASKTRKSSLSGMVALFLVLTMLSGSVFVISLPVAYATEPGHTVMELSETPIEPGSISAIQARDIALETVGGGSLVSFLYDNDLNIFRIEIVNNNIRFYSVVDSVTGNAMVYNTEEIFEGLITWEQALRAALSHLPGSSLTDGSMEVINNQAVFTFFIESNGREYEVLISNSGSLISIESTEAR